MNPVDARGERHLCPDETATAVNRRWLCQCPGGPYWHSAAALAEHRASVYDTKRNPTVGGTPRIDPRYGLLHKALNLRRAAANPLLPPGNSAARELRKLLESGAVTDEQLDAHERDVEANGSPLYTLPKRTP